jgi:hypothetical protein
MELIMIYKKEVNEIIDGYNLEASVKKTMLFLLENNIDTIIKDTDDEIKKIEKERADTIKKLQDDIEQKKVQAQEEIAKVKTEKIKVLIIELFEKNNINPKKYKKQNKATNTKTNINKIEEDKEENVSTIENKLNENK